MKTAIREIDVQVRQRVRPEGASRYALIIGINKHRDNRIDLQYARPDAEEMAKLLSNPEIGAVSRDNLTLLLDEQATMVNIKKGFSELAKKAAQGDTVFLCFAGHGAREQQDAYWVTHDTDIDDLYGTSISNRDITHFMERIQAKRFVAFLDCCHAAAMVHQQDKGRTPLNPEDLLLGFQGQGRVTMASSDREEKSMELAEEGHGLFMGYLLQGLRGEADANQDGVVDADELWNFLKARFQSRSSSQHPKLQGELSHDLALTINPELIAHRSEVSGKLNALINQGVKGADIDRLQQVWLDMGRNKNWRELYEQITEWAEGKTTTNSLIRLLRHTPERSVSQSDGRKPGPKDAERIGRRPRAWSLFVSGFLLAGVCGVLVWLLFFTHQPVDQRIADLRKDKDQLSKQIAAFQTEKKSLESAFASVKGENLRLQEKLARVQSERNDLNAQKTQLEQQIKTLTTENETLKSQVKAVNSKEKAQVDSQSAYKKQTGEISRDGRFISYEDSTVLDTKTGLMWASKDNGRKIDWYDAKEYCESYQGGGYTDWRMPTIAELKSLYDPDAENNYNLATRLIRLTSVWVWSRDAPTGSSAAGFFFNSGESRVKHRSYAYNGRALPVRAGT